MSTKSLLSLHYTCHLCTKMDVNNGSRSTKRPRNSIDRSEQQASVKHSAVGSIPTSGASWDETKERSNLASGGRHVNDDGLGRSKKVARRGAVHIAEDKNETFMLPPRGTTDHLVKSDELSTQASLLLLAQAEASVAQQGPKLIELTPKGIQRAGIALNKTWDNNQLLRSKYPDQPEQYMDSEVTLYEHIRALQAVAASPESLYLPLIEAEIPTTLLQIVGQHPNTDITTAIWAVWAEWIDPSLLQNDEQDSFVRPVVDLTCQLLKNGTDVLMESLGRLDTTETQEDGENDDDDDDVGQGVGHILNVVEHLLEIDNMLPLVRGADQSITLTIGNLNVTQQLCQAKLGFVPWLLEQTDSRQKGERTNDKSNMKPWRDRCFEILALLAPHEELYQPPCSPDWRNLPYYHAVWKGNEKPSENLDGIEILLQGVAVFRKRQPLNDTELDVLENTCIILDAALTYSSTNLEAFVGAQGIELVFRCIKERVHSGGVALKCLDFTGAEPIHQKACLHMVAIASALKYILPLLMNQNLPRPALLDTMSKKAKKLKKKEWSTNMEQTTIRILYALMRLLPDNDPQDSQARLIAKFADDAAKCDRIVELLLFYDQQARTAEFNFYRFDTLEEEAMPDEEAVNWAALEAKLAGGGDLFHRLGAMAAFLCVHSKVCHQTILAKLRQQQSGMGLITVALQEFISVLGPSDQKEKLKSYLEKLQ